MKYKYSGENTVFMPTLNIVVKKGDIVEFKENPNTALFTEYIEIKEKVINIKK